jgi:NADPH-dependent 2,4-dienoyl-CoA reductase/sulfur reductase-like enzyme
VHNPMIGREAELGTVVPAPARKRVVVAGAGPAGLEAARMAAIRGHEVVVLERGERAGGQVRISSTAPGRAEIAGIVDWLEGAARRAGVRFELAVTATADRVLELAPDAVIIATGSEPRPLPDAFRAGAVDVRSAMRGASLGERVVVYAEDPLTAGPTCADLLAARGHRVTVVAPHYAVGEMIDDTQKPLILRRLLKAGVELLPLHRALGFDGRRVTIEHVLTGATSEIDADSCVIASAPRANGGLAGELEGRVKELHVVGDAVAPRRVHNAILEGTRAARSI